jgi:hypothetical protein
MSCDAACRVGVAGSAEAVDAIGEGETGVTTTFAGVGGGVPPHANTSRRHDE